MGERPEGLTLGRIEPNGNYEPSNCEWQTWKKQNNTSNNTRQVEYQGFKGSLKAVCEHFNLNYDAVKGRLCMGWTLEKSLATPVIPGQKT
jgi:hypothetical protein